MRALPTLALLVAAILAGVTGTAAGQAPEAPFRLELKMSPEKTGTKDRPRGVKLAGALRFEAAEAVERPVVTRGRLLIPRGLEYHGGEYPACARQAIGDGGPGNCPKRSIMGSSWNGLIADEVEVRRRVVFVNGGARRIWAHATLYFPALVQEPVAIDVKRRRGSQWAYELAFVVPENLRIVAGVPISAPSQLKFQIGGKPYARRYLTADRCPKRGFLPFRISLAYSYSDKATGESTYRGRLTCRR